MQKIIIAACLVLLLSVSAFAALQVIPTTTLAAETGNNTSAANNFSGLPNGNAAAGNISKAPIRSLLYTGATTRIYAHLMPWFGITEAGYRQHVDVGYESADPAQATRQVNDMISRGIDGAIIDWYGEFKTHHNTASLNVLYAAEKVPNFEIALTEDIGAVSSSSDPTQKTIDDLKYAWSAFMQSPAYMRRNGQPVVFFFGFDGSAIDMAKVKSSVPGNPLFIFRNSGAFSATASDGAFAWLAPKTTDYETYMSLGYLDSFYKTALRYPTQQNFGSGFKGFDDTIASWSPAGGRHIPQFCGQTWLQSMANASIYYSSSKQLENLQLVTWNDYEEGSAVEPGIDGCIGVNASVAADKLTWTISGDESVVDHYSIFVSTDGTNLMPLTDVPAGTRAHDLKPYDLAAGSYEVFVKVVGKASIRNVMSSATSYTVVAAPAPTPSDWKISVGPSPASMTTSGSAALSVALQPTSSAYNSAVKLDCSNLPANMKCTFAQSTVTPGAGATVQLAVSATTAVTTGASKRHQGWLMASMAFGSVGMFAVGSRRRMHWTLLALTLVASFITVGCGAGGGSTAITTTVSKSQGGIQPGAYTISVVSTSGTTVRTATTTVIVQ